MADLHDLGFWGRLKYALMGNRFLDKGSSAAPYIGEISHSGETINPENALKLSAAWACVRLRAQTLSTLPLHLKQNNGEIASHHPLYGLLHDAPNADMSASEFWEAITANQDLNGNAYALIHRNKQARVIALELLDSQTMSVKRAKNGQLSYAYQKDGKTVEYPENEVLHFRGFSLDGIVGLSPIHYHAESLGLQIAANRAAAHEFRNSMKAGGFLETGERVLNAEQRSRLQASLEQFARPEKAGSYMVLEAGMKVSSNNGIRMNPNDAQLLESRYFGIEEICRAFAVPPQLIGHTDKASSWASSLDSTNRGFLTYSIRPLLVRYEQTLARKLLSPAERKQFYPQFSVEGLLRADPAARAGFYSQMLQNGVFTRNHVRSLEDLPPIAGGDDLTVQVNLMPLNQLGKVQTASASAANDEAMGQPSS